MALTDKLTAIGDAIRAKTGSTEKLALDEMVETIAVMETDNTNFSIVGGTTEPTNPKENTIWINTDVEIGEYHFSATQPTARVDGTELQTGDVWICTTTSNPLIINIVKKGSIQICINNCYQYVDGNWVHKVLKGYCDGQWKNGITYIVKDGAMQNGVSFWKQGTDGNGGSIAYNNGYITITSSSSGSSAGYVSYGTTVYLPTSEYTKMYIDYSASVGHANGSNFVSLGSYEKSLAQGTHSRQTLTIDLSSVTDNRVLSFTARAWVTSTTTFNIYNVWME